jgi:hypothetical protein
MQIAVFWDVRPCSLVDYTDVSEIPVSDKLFRPLITSL